MKHLKLVGQIPVEPYLLKFVQHLENLEPGEAINISHECGIIPFTLKMLLTNKTNIQEESLLTYKKFESKYPARIRFKISARMQVFNTFYLTRKSISVFNQFLRTMFYDLLLERIKSGIQEGQTQKDIIYQFMRELDIEEDISFDTIIRKVNRVRKVKKIPTIHQQKCPQTSEP